MALSDIAAVSPGLDVIDWDYKKKVDYLVEYFQPKKLVGTFLYLG